MSLLKKIPANIWLLGFVSLLSDLGSDMILPILPLFIASLGGGALAVGLIGGLGDGVANLLRIPAGWWSDKIARRKPFLWLGYGGSAIVKIMFATVTSWWQLLILRPIERAGKGIRDAPRDALITQSVSKRFRGFTFGVQRAMDTFGSLIGAVFAFIALQYFGLSFPTIIVIGALISLLALIPLFPVKEAKAKPLHKGFIVSMRSLPPIMRRYVLISTLFALGNFSNFLLILRAQELTGSSISAIALYILFQVFFTAFLVPVGRWSDKIGRIRVLPLGYLLWAVVAFGFIATNSIPELIALFALYGIFNALIDGTQRAVTADLSPIHLKGTALGTFYTSTGFASMIAGAIGGALYQTVGATAAFAYAAALAIVSAFLLLAFVRNNS